MVIGRSRSVSGRLRPARAALAVGGDGAMMPLMIGPMILSSVQIAATPMVPAPMKRTCWRNTVPTTASTSAAGRQRRRVAVSQGTRHEPADDQADEHGDADRQADQVADADQRHRQAGRDGRCAAPNLKVFAASVGDQAGLGQDGIAGRDQRARQTIAARPRRFSSAPPTPAPTFSTSAAATPSG